MNTIAVVLVLIAAIGGAAALIFLRSKFNNMELRGTDIAAATFLFVVGLVVTGQIAEFEFGGSSVKLREELERQITVPETTVFERSLPERLPFILRKTGNVSYSIVPVNCPTTEVGSQKWAPSLGEAISPEEGTSPKILGRFYPFEASDYLVFTEVENCVEPNSDFITYTSGSERFYALLRIEDFRALGTYVRLFENGEKADLNRPLTVDEFKRLVEEESSWLDKLRSYVKRDQAIRTDTRKVDAIAKMVDIGTAALPIVNEQGQFLAIIEREILAASLLADFGRAVSD